MTAAPNTLPSSLDVMLTILSGPETGVGYKLVGQAVSLGRASDNDIVLQDNKSSRNHARIEYREGTYWVKDLGSQNGIFINGVQARHGILKAGDQLTIGSTTMRFGPAQTLSLVNAAPPPPPLVKSQNPLGAVSPESMGWLPPLSGSSGQARSMSAGQPNKLPIFGVIIAVVVIALISTKQKNAAKSLTLKDDSALQSAIANTEETNEKRQQEIMRKGKDTQQYSEAQAFYLRGFREFREANYPRAIQNFEASLALYPEHPLAKRYLERSRLKLNETITAALERGEKDFLLQKYTNAFNEYRTVLLLTNDPRNPSFQLAQKRIEAINLILMSNK